MLKNRDLTEKQKIIKNFFNFSLNFMSKISEGMVDYIYDIINPLDKSHHMYMGYTEDPIEGYSSSLENVLLDPAYDRDKIKNLILEIYHMSILRENRIQERRKSEFKIEHSKEEQNNNLEINLLYI